MDKGIVTLCEGRQVISLPKALAFPDDVKLVDVVPHGRARILVPAGESWDSWFDGDGPSDDFMLERDQPESA